MSESKTYVFQPDGMGNSALASLMPMLQQRGVDPSVLAMLSNNRGIFNGGGWDGIIALVVIAAIFGWGGNGLFGNRGGNNSTEREMIMSAIQRNGTDLSSLASSLNCSEGQIMQAVNNVATQICNLSAAEGQNSMQIINSIQAGNTSVLSKLADCCCENRLAIANQTNALQNAINGTNVGMERGFSSVAYAAQQQTCDLKQNADCNTRSILAKLDQIEDSRKDREISNLTAQLTAANSRAERQSELAPIYKALNDIQCKQPTTVTTPYQPFVTVPNCVAWQYGLNGFNGFGNNGGGFL
ncbi:MAG: hypothetical protein MJZ98_01330 [Paludibacteraceae bacterium]|nr:hypothetical protein [Paludibacteraceae bacterium]